MPEGDTVYQTAQRLTETLAGKSLVRGELRHPRLSTLDLRGRVVLGARSVGKHLFVRFDRDLSLHNHLGLDGSWRFFRPGAGVNHQARVVLGTESSTAVGLNLHQLSLVPTDEEHRLVDHLGPDLLDPSWSAEHAAEAARRLRAEGDREIGVALLDQTLLAGIGNVYKAEVCFLLGVSPWTPVSEVDIERAVQLSRDLLLRNATPPPATPPATRAATARSGSTAEPARAACAAAAGCAPPCRATIFANASPTTARTANRARAVSTRSGRASSWSWSSCAAPLS